MHFRYNWPQPKNQEGIRHNVGSHEQQWFQMTEKCKALIDWLTGRITNGLIGWSCSKVNFTWKQPSSQSVKLQRGGSFIWNTRESGFHFREGNHLVVTQKPHVSLRMWEHEHVVQKPIILKAMVSITNQTVIYSDSWLDSMETQRETGHSFFILWTWMEILLSSSKNKWFSENKYLLHL